MCTLEKSYGDYKYPYHRLNTFAHPPGCTCEVCWARIERAIVRYLPGLIPAEPEDPRIGQLETIISRQRAEISQLRTELQRRAPVTAQGASPSDSEFPIVCKVRS